MKLSFLNDTIKTHSNQAEKENGGKDMINGFRYFVKNNMEIILDTSTAMHYEGFSKFVEENERDIEASGKKIQVLSAVWFELIRNYNSVDKEKAEAANQAIAILSSHRNIFKIDEGKEIFQDEIEDAFADKEILSKLTLDKTEVSILLITNDRIISNGTNELMKNVIINMSLIGWPAASSLIAGAICISTVIISGIKTYEKLESKKLLYNYEYNRIKNLEMAIS